jgi:hypothetical protein
MPCVTLGNTKSQECGRPRSLGVIQGSLASTICTSSKLVLGDFGFVHIFVRNLLGMNEDESLPTTSYYFVRGFQLFMSCLSYIGIVKG